MSSKLVGRNLRNPLCKAASQSEYLGGRVSVTLFRSTRDRKAGFSRLPCELLPAPRLSTPFAALYNRAAVRTTPVF
jgi:hypothetical protein